MRFRVLMTLPLAVFSLQGSAEPLADVALVKSVQSVYDGDTLRADIAGWPAIVGTNMPIRVAGVDTPELRSGCETDEQRERERTLAREARDYAANLLGQADIITLHNVQRGSFFRLLAEVRVDGESLGDALLTEGLAVPFESGADPWCLVSENADNE